LIPDHIERETLIDAPVDVVWRVVTEPAQISRWLSDAAELDLRPGGEGAISWKEHGTVDLRVERVEPPHLFSFRWVYPEGAEPREGNSTLVEFTLSEEGDGTRLRVVESGLRAIEWSEEQKAEFLESHTQGWARHIGDLEEYVAQQRQGVAR
jgi:uncharacterized protein YndB with AHSA1/START domain